MQFTQPIPAMNKHISAKQITSYSISDLASEFGITTRSIRFYEEKGMLSPRRQGQRRIYTAADRVKLKLILRGKRLGISLDESKKIIGMYDPQSGNQDQLKRLINKIRQQRTQLLQQLDDLKSLMTELDDAEANCLKALKIA